MRNFLTLVFVAIGLLFCKNGNSQAASSSLEINKVQRPALFFEAEGGAGDLEDALIAYFKTKGFKKEKVKGGLIAFKSVRTEKMPFTMDYYFKVESKGRKSETSSIWMSNSTGVDVFVDTADAEKWKAINDFTSFVRSTVFPYYSLDNKVSAKQKDIKNSKEDLEDLEKKKKKIEKEIEETKKKISNTEGEVSELNKQKEVLQRQL